MTPRRVDSATGDGGPSRIEIVDSHTEGEPTRVVISGWPQPPGETMQARREALRQHYDHLRRGVVLEPRGHDAIVGALLTPPVNAGSAAGVIFFNDAGYLGMCGHGTIGVVRTLAELGRLDSAEIRLDTPAGTVAACSDESGCITIANVPARVSAADVRVHVPGIGEVTGDVAYGGNWFFLTEVKSPELNLAHSRELLAMTMAIRDALEGAGITGDRGEQVDHVELFGKPESPDADSRNFVLCPGVAFDRSPCGTGTSAKLASLHARGKLAPGQRWVQESIVGGRFTAWLEQTGSTLVPHIQGRAYITGRSTLIFDPADPFRYGWHS